MQGKILDYDILTAKGIILNSDGERFYFTGGDWKSSDALPQVGLTVDFITEEDASDAKEIYALNNFMHSNIIAPNIVPNNAPIVVSDTQGNPQTQEQKDLAVAKRTVNAGANLVKDTVKNDKRIVAGVLALFVGFLGVHKFYLGYTKQGIIMLFAFMFGWLLLGIPTFAVIATAIAEGIIYLTKSNAEFNQIYIENKKPWF